MLTQRREDAKEFGTLYHEEHEGHKDIFRYVAQNLRLPAFICGFPER